jgi:hypothetical protein
MVFSFTSQPQSAWLCFSRSLGEAEIFRLGGAKSALEQSRNPLLGGAALRAAFQHVLTGFSRRGRDPADEIKFRSSESSAEISHLLLHQHQLTVFNLEILNVIRQFQLIPLFRKFFLQRIVDQ